MNESKHGRTPQLGDAPLTDRQRPGGSAELLGAGAWGLPRSAANFHRARSTADFPRLPSATCCTTGAATLPAALASSARPNGGGLTYKDPTSLAEKNAIALGICACSTTNTGANCIITNATGPQTA